MRRQAVGTAPLVGAIIAVGIVVGGISYYIGQSAGGSTDSVTTVTSTSSTLSTVVRTSTTTVVSTTTATALCPGCVDDSDGDGV